jgi:hypothetical protein
MCIFCCREVARVSLEFHTCIHVHTRIHACTYTYTCMHIGTCMSEYMMVFVFLLCADACKCTYTCIYVCIYVCMHVCANKLLLFLFCLCTFDAYKCLSTCIWMYIDTCMHQNMFFSNIDARVRWNMVFILFCAFHAYKYLFTYIDAHWYMYASKHRFRFVVPINFYTHVCILYVYIVYIHMVLYMYVCIEVGVCANTFCFGWECSVCTCVRACIKLCACFLLIYMHFVCMSMFLCQHNKCVVNYSVTSYTVASHTVTSHSVTPCNVTSHAVTSHTCAMNHTVILKYWAVLFLISLYSFLIHSL